jgi:menaquinone-dependent protoporphyrinogen IX oxidase
MKGLVTAGSKHGSTNEIAALRVPYGDFRDWMQIEQWALEIADELARPATILT